MNENYISLSEIADILDMGFDEEHAKMFCDAMAKYSNFIKDGDKINEIKIENSIDNWKEIASSLSCYLCQEHAFFKECDFTDENTYKRLVEEAENAKRLKNMYEYSEILRTLNNVALMALIAYGAVINEQTFDTRKRTAEAFASNTYQSCSNTETSKSKDGFVYIAKQINESDIYKIGCTKDITKRLKTFKVGNAFVEMVASKKTSERYKNESFLHKYFASKRVNGEWFKLDTDDLKLFSDIFDFNFHLNNKEGK